MNVNVQYNIIFGSMKEYGPYPTQNTTLLGDKIQPPCDVR